MGAIERQRIAIEERLDKLKSEFDGLVQDSNRASWRGMIGDPTRLLALHARAADLLIVGARSSTTRRSSAVDLGELIVSAGRPILVPADDHGLMTAESILVAWKDTREARRAVVDAMPFLTAARQVLVTTIEEGDRFGARESAADVVRFLIKHGVKARSDVIDVERSDATEALVQVAADISADLIISGGYGHGRLREWILGGVTRTLLQKRPTNLLMAN